MRGSCLDINTPRGSRTKQDARRAISQYLSRTPSMSFVQTDDKKPADVDGFLVRDGVIAAVVEIKCRYDVTLPQFRERYNNEWLITLDKLERGRAIADALCAPLVGFVYLVPDSSLLVQRLYDPDARDWTCRMYAKRTQTQATVNGGLVIRENAFVDMSEARCLLAA